MARKTYPPTKLRRLESRWRRGDLVRQISSQERVPLRTIQGYARLFKWEKGRDHRFIDPHTKKKCKAMYCAKHYSITKIEQLTDVTRATLHRWVKTEGWVRQ